MSTSSIQKRKECHWLPCSIANDCAAPINVFFHPESLDDTIHQHEATAAVESKEDKKEQELLGSNTQGAAFRGRELLSCSQCELPSQIAGSVITLNRKSSSGDLAPNMKIGETFHTITEWEHKWNEDKLRSEAVGQSTASKGINLLQILRSAHDPI
mmetsp:Transcript_3594/g.4061  ORF Transcript_3594/g.4061 Transcript_3594/m.4061 type:complete len:156 (+) Transcript_3594:46-513(+)